MPASLATCRAKKNTEVILPPFRPKRPRPETDKYLASSFITGKLEVAYRFNAWDVGATVLMPLTDPFTDKSLNKSRPLNVQLFVRWRIKRDDEDE